MSLLELSNHFHILYELVTSFIYLFIKQLFIECLWYSGVRCWEYNGEKKNSIDSALIEVGIWGVTQKLIK